MLSILETVAGAITDPEAFINDQLQAMQDLYNAAFEDTEAFIAEVVSGLFDLDYLDEQGAAQWLGKTACSIAIQYLTVSAGAKVADLVNDYLGNPRPGNGRPNDQDDDNDDQDDDDRNDDDDENNDGPGCRTNSFPTGTLVRMGNGSYKPINLIEPGDHVLAHDLNNDQWRPQLVLDQWSHLDDGHMATVTISNGTQITATDHHLFWVDSDQEWLELDQIQPGDQLLSPNGPTQVTNLTIADPTETLVWELTVATDHNFTVHTGETDLLVHNVNGCGMTVNQMNRAIQRGQAPRGITRVDTPRGSVPGEQIHVAFENTGSGAAPQLNIDGTWKHGPPVALTRDQAQWLTENGWTLP